MGFLWWRFLCLETSTLMQRKSFILVLVYLCVTELLACSRWLKRLKLLFLNHGILSFFFSPVKFTKNVRPKELLYRGTSRRAFEKKGMQRIAPSRKLITGCFHSHMWLLSMQMYCDKRKCLHKKKSSTSTGLVCNSNMAALFWQTNIKNGTQCDMALYC